MILMEIATTVRTFVTQSLSISGCEALTDTSLHALASIAKNLKYFDCSGCFRSVCNQIMVMMMSRFLQINIIINIFLGSLATPWKISRRAPLVSSQSQYLTATRFRQNLMMMVMLMVLLMVNTMVINIMLLMIWYHVTGRSLSRASQRMRQPRLWPDPILLQKPKILNFQTNLHKFQCIFCLLPFDKKIKNIIFVILMQLIFAHRRLPEMWLANLRISVWAPILVIIQTFLYCQITLW